MQPGFYNTPMKKRLPSCQKCFFIALILLGFISCDKKPDYWNIPDEFQSWCRYREGSYWIYRNEKTLQVDCTYVTRYTTGKYQHEGDGYKVLDYDDWESSDITGSFLSGITAGSGSKNFATMSLSGKFLAPSINFSTELWTNPKYQEAWYTGANSSGVVAVYPTEEVNGNSFTNVYHCRIESQTWDGDSVIVDGHLVKSIGLVKYKKRIDHADTTWTLLRWHVNQ